MYISLKFDIFVLAVSPSWFNGKPNFDSRNKKNAGEYFLILHTKYKDILDQSIDFIRKPLHIFFIEWYNFQYLYMKTLAIDSLNCTSQNL